VRSQILHLDSQLCSILLLDYLTVCKLYYKLLTTQQLVSKQKVTRVKSQEHYYKYFVSAIAV
jgi:hypothetical protein